MEIIAVESLLRFARIYCAERLPWFAPALFSCRIRLTDAVPLAGISSRMDIFFNPGAVRVLYKKSHSKEHALAQLGFLWVHEISHILRAHEERGLEIGAEPQCWNLACDLEINDANWEGLVPPEEFPGYFPSTFGLPEGKIAEYYYAKLKEDENGLKSSSTDEGSGIHGQSRYWELDEGDKQGFSDLLKEQIRLEVGQQLMKQFGAGDMPGDWDRWVEKVQRPRTGWRKVLKHRLRTLVAQAGGERIDYSYARPNRRQAVIQPFILPALSGSQESRITCVIDTSGSVGSEEIGQAIAEVFQILEAMRAPVTVIPCDSAAYRPISISASSDYLKLKTLEGGGGTNMIAGIEAALNQKPGPGAIVVLTDGYTPFPARPYRVPVIWGIFRRGNCPKPPQPKSSPWPREAIIIIDM
jgi:predicted metal-dependent peptidase